MTNSTQTIAPPVWKDARVAAGMKSQSRSLESARTDGRRLGGWKLGLGAPMARQALGLSGAAMGFLIADNILQTGAAIDLRGWKQPMLEGEIAVRLGDVVTCNMSDDEIKARIAGIGPAIELIDLDPSIKDVEGIIASNIFQRYVIVGPETSVWDEEAVTRLATEVKVDSAVVQSTNDPTLLTGGVLLNVRHAAEYLDAFGLNLSAGEILITGAVTTNIQVASSQTAEVCLGKLGSVFVNFTSVN